MTDALLKEPSNLYNGNAIATLKKSFAKYWP